MTAPFGQVALRCGLCDKVLTNRERVVLDPAGRPVAHEACSACPSCQSTFTIWRGVDVLNGRNVAEGRCLSCLHG